MKDLPLHHRKIHVPQFLLSTDKEDIKDFEYLTNRLEKKIAKRKTMEKDEEKEKWEEDGWPKKYGWLSPVHDNIEDTHKSYNEAVEFLLNKLYKKKKKENSNMNNMLPLFIASQNRESDEPIWN
ncbi:hypothetical protein Glove_165g163 [Diversispora epigaea]|uniref:Uncharacterized protein n=1 Tax=Diversispora epigaea TaxID=1348612 RepID=A0A397IZY6_9GLOM|nr:hypothetical protein Glove_165g163 [Diversispora epigaea]